MIFFDYEMTLAINPRTSKIRLFQRRTSKGLNNTDSRCLKHPDWCSCTIDTDKHRCDAYCDVPDKPSVLNGIDVEALELYDIVFAAQDYVNHIYT